MPGLIGDNFCDDNNNNKDCEFDGGDCCNPESNKQWCIECKCNSTGKSFQTMPVFRLLRLQRIAHWHQNASFDSLLSRAGFEHRGKGWIFRGTNTRRWPYWATVSSTQAGTGCTSLHLIGSIVADCQTLT